MNYARVLHTLGTFGMLISGILVVPAIIALVSGEASTLPAFLVPAGGGVVAGWLLSRRFRRASRAIYRREGLLIVTGCWLAAAFIGAIPYVIAGMTDSPAGAFFESMSGFTTTGSTVLSGLDDMPRGLLFWRSMTHWLGGIGIVVIFVAVLPALGVGGRLLYQFEVPRVESDDLKPRIQETALALFQIYLLLTVTLIFSLLLCGLDLFESVIHTFGTVATGGFSSHDASVGHFGSPLVESVITVFMFLAGINFSLYYRARRSGLRVIGSDPEFRAYLIIMLVGSLTTFLFVLPASPASGGQTLLDATFQVVSIGTTTGYGTADYDAWPEPVRILFVVLMFIGGCAGSTAGGMKVVRILIVSKAIAHELRRFVRPHRVRALMFAGHEVGDEVARGVLVLFASSVFIFVASSLVMTTMGLDLVTATSSVSATLWNVGPGLAQVGPTQNFADIPEAGKLLLSFLMLFGRLEVFTALAVCTRGLYED